MKIALDAIKNLVPVVEKVISSVEVVVPVINTIYNTCEATQLGGTDGKRFTDETTVGVQTLGKCTEMFGVCHETLKTTINGITSTVTDTDKQVIILLNALFGSSNSINRMAQNINSLIPKEMKGEIPNSIDECVTMKDYAYYAIGDNGSVSDVTKKAAGNWSKESYEKFLATYAKAKGVDLGSDSYKEFHDKWMANFETRTEKVKAKQQAEKQATKTADSSVTSTTEVCEADVSYKTEGGATRIMYGIKTKPSKDWSQFKTMVWSSGYPALESADHQKMLMALGDSIPPAIKEYGEGQGITLDGYTLMGICINESTGGKKSPNLFGADKELSTRSEEYAKNAAVHALINAGVAENAKEAEKLMANDSFYIQAGRTLAYLNNTVNNGGQIAGGKNACYGSLTPSMQDNIEAWRDGYRNKAREVSGYSAGYTFYNV